MKALYYSKHCLIVLAIMLFGCSEEGSAPGDNAGQGGSMARFALAGNYLYTVNNTTLTSYSLSEPDRPVKQNELLVGRGIETIFPYNNKLFLGSETGMYIYDLTTPSSPEFVSNFQHIYSCDPVVVNDEYAYITLRSGSSCRQGVNRLEVVSIRNLSNPQLLKTYPMSNPHGLGIDGELLFVTTD